MFEEDQDTLAAEYVLGTLSAEEREHAEALISFDPGFEAAVRQWERRLGELNVMVEAVEPPTEVWDKIKQEVGPQIESVEPEAAHSLEATPADGTDLLTDFDAPSAVATMASDLSLVEKALSLPPTEAAAETPPHASIVPPPEPRQVERGAEAIYLTRRVRRWRGWTIGLAAIAALLAAYIAVSQVAPDLIPAQLRTAGARMMMARTEAAGQAPQDRLVAVLHQEPTAPAFLLTVDTLRRTLVVRRVSATPEAGRSYELWLISDGSPARSLGVIGNDEFTQRALPGNVDVDALGAATYAVSLEPSGGSPSGAPTGPVLFTGKAVEALPASPPPSPSPKT
jgi:anti-sigma-K factor RskA